MGVQYRYSANNNYSADSASAANGQATYRYIADSEVTWLQSISNSRNDAAVVYEIK